MSHTTPTIYRSGKKPFPLPQRGIQKVQNHKSLGRPTFENGPGSAIKALSHKTIKSAEGLGNHACEGKGDVLLGKYKETRAHRSLGFLPKTVKIQSQCVRVALFRDSAHINCRFGSPGLNLPCEGLLLGMRSRDRKGIPYRAPPRASDLHQ
jgi:hypothetical protein